MVQFMSDKSGLKTRSLELNTLGTAQSPASTEYVLVSSLSMKIAMGTRFKVSSERLEKHEIENLQPLVYKASSFTTTPWGASSSSPVLLKAFLLK